MKAAEPIRLVLAAAERWAAAVNADGQFGTWRFAMARSIPQVKEMLDRQALTRPGPSEAV